MLLLSVSKCSTPMFLCTETHTGYEHTHADSFLFFQSLIWWLHSVLYNARGLDVDFFFFLLRLKRAFISMTGLHCSSSACRVSHSIKPSFFSSPILLQCVLLKWFFSVLSSKESWDVAARLSQPLNYKTGQRSVGHSTSSVSIHFFLFTSDVTQWAWNNVI